MVHIHIIEPKTAVEFLDKHRQPVMKIYTHAVQIQLVLVRAVGLFKIFVPTY
jgi:hypothetical protein